MRLPACTWKAEMYEYDPRSLDDLIAERKALREAGDPATLHADRFRKIMPEGEGRAAYDAYDRMYGQG